EPSTGRPDDEARRGRVGVLVLPRMEVEVEPAEPPTASVDVVHFHGGMPDGRARNPAVSHAEHPARDHEQSVEDLPELEIRTQSFPSKHVRFGPHEAS